MRWDFVVLGATGIQGRIATRDLLEKGYRVLMCGRDKSRIIHLFKKYKKTSFTYLDVRDIKKTSKIIKNSGAKVVVNCVEGNWNLHVLKACISAGANSIDLGSEIPMTKEQFSFHEKLKKKNLIHITGIGSVPGIGNIMLRYASDKFDEIDDVEVGFSWDSNIKKFVVPFSIESITEEFTNPAPIVNRNKFIKKVPLDSIIEDYHRGIGFQKEFFVRHPETYTFYHYFRNKGLKNIRFYAGFPKHSFEKIMDLIELGLGSKNEINFKGTKIKPIEFLTEVLKKIKIPEGYKETENLWVRIKGKKNKRNKRMLMECIVPTLKGWEDAGCNIDTGIPASILAQMIYRGAIKEKGSYSPEAVVPPELFFKELAKRKMKVLENGKKIN